MTAVTQWSYAKLVIPECRRQPPPNVVMASPPLYNVIARELFATEAICVLRKKDDAMKQAHPVIILMQIASPQHTSPRVVRNDNIERAGHAL